MVCFACYQNQTKYYSSQKLSQTPLPLKDLDKNIIIVWHMPVLFYI